MVKSFTPLSDNVLVERLQSVTASPGGIALPNAFVEKSNRGKVICVGKGKVLDNGEIRKMEVKVGDLVLFGSSRIEEITVEGDKYLIMGELNIIAVIGK